MNPKLTASFCALLMTGLWCFAVPARGDDAATLRSEVRQTDTLTARHGATTVQTRLVSDFSAFAGSDANAQSLITGLRSGTLITLTSPATGTPTTPPTTTSLTFDPPTRPMGYGNVFISLALAKQQLASYGITNPTSQQLEAALTGGTITVGSGATARTVTLQGILTQRADGMGWGAIAKSQGMNLGRVVSGLKSANQQLATGSTASTNGRTAAGSGAQTQSTTTSATTAHGRSPNAHARGEFSGDTSGIVTAGGSAVGISTNANAQAGARGVGAGIVTGSGAAVRAGGSGQGLAKGLNK